MIVVLVGRARHLRNLNMNGLRERLGKLNGNCEPRVIPETARVMRGNYYLRGGPLILAPRCGSFRFAAVAVQ